MEQFSNDDSFVLGHETQEQRGVSTLSTQVYLRFSIKLHRWPVHGTCSNAATVSTPFSKPCISNKWGTVPETVILRSVMMPWLRRLVPKVIHGGIPTVGMSSTKRVVLNERNAIPDSAEYWLSVDPYAHLPRTKLQMFTAGASFTSREWESGYLQSVMVSQFLFVGLRYYVQIFSLTLDQLTQALNGVDSSGSLAAICSTLVLVVAMLVLALVYLPASILNNAMASNTQAALSFLYGFALTTGFTYYSTWSAVSNGPILAQNIYGLVIASILGFTYFVFAMFTLYSKYKGYSNYYSNRLSAYRVYTLWRLNGMSRSILSLPARPYVSTEVTSLRQDHWTQRTTTTQHLKAAWMPHTPVLQAAKEVFDFPPELQSAYFLGILIIVFLGIVIIPVGELLYDNIGDSITEYSIALDYLTESSQPQEVVDLVQSMLGFYTVLQGPLYWSIVIGAYLALFWTCSFIPAIYYSFQKVVLELRVGIAENTGLLNKARREFEMPTFRAMYFFGCFLSAVFFAFVLSFLLFFLCVLLVSWPPFYNLVWYLNWLWLPSLVMIIVNMVIKTYQIKTFFEKADPPQANLDIIPEGSEFRQSLTLIGKFLFVLFLS